MSTFRKERHKRTSPESRLQQECKRYVKRVKEWQESKTLFSERAVALLRDPSFVSRMRRRYIEQLIQYEKTRKSAEYMSTMEKELRERVRFSPSKESSPSDRLFSISHDRHEQSIRVLQKVEEFLLSHSLGHENQSRNEFMEILADFDSAKRSYEERMKYEDEFQRKIFDVDEESITAIQDRKDAPSLTRPSPSWMETAVQDVASRLDREDRVPFLLLHEKGVLKDFMEVIDSYKLFHQKKDEKEVEA